MNHELKLIKARFDSMLKGYNMGRVELGCCARILKSEFSSQMWKGFLSDRGLSASTVDKWITAYEFAEGTTPAVALKQLKTQNPQHWRPKGKIVDKNATFAKVSRLLQHAYDTSTPRGLSDVAMDFVTVIKVLAANIRTVSAPSISINGARDSEATTISVKINHHSQ